jgi:hypothetical protein
VIEEQAGHGSPDRPELTSCPGYEDRWVISHATSLFSAEHPVERYSRRVTVQHHLRQASRGRQIRLVCRTS